MSSTSLQMENKNILDDSTKTKLEIFYNNTQETLEKGFETAFKNLNESLITTINTAFSSFESEKNVVSITTGKITKKQCQD